MGATVVTGVIDHALDVDDIFLVTGIEQQFRPAARTRQIDIDDLLDAAGERVITTTLSDKNTAHRTEWVTNSTVLRSRSRY